MADAQHTANVRELAWLTLGALKGVEQPASATGVDYGTYTALRKAARPDISTHRLSASHSLAASQSPGLARCSPSAASQHRTLRTQKHRPGHGAAPPGRDQLASAAMRRPVLRTARGRSRA